MEISHVGGMLAADQCPHAITPRQKWQLRRNVLIYALAKDGFSQRVIADGFDLATGSVAEIVQVMRAADAARA